MHYSDNLITTDKQSRKCNSIKYCLTIGLHKCSQDIKRLHLGSATCCGRRRLGRRTAKSSQVRMFFQSRRTKAWLFAMHVQLRFQERDKVFLFLLGTKELPNHLIKYTLKKKYLCTCFVGKQRLSQFPQMYRLNFLLQREINNVFFPSKYFSLMQIDMINLTLFMALRSKKIEN